MQFEKVSKFALNVKQMIVNFKQALVFEGANTFECTYIRSKTYPLDCEAGEKSRSRVALRAPSTALEASSRATRTTSLSTDLSDTAAAAAVSYLVRSSPPVGTTGATEGAGKKER